MSLGDHLAELRRRIIVCLLAFGGVFLAGMLAWRWLWEGVRLPLVWAAALTGDDPARLVPFKWDGPMDGFLAVVRVDLMLTVVLVFPVIACEAWAFAAPGLKAREKRALAGVFTFGTGLFLLGAFVAFRFAAPVGMHFLIWFNSTLEGSVNFWTGDRYVAFVTLVCLGFGLAFETPLVMMLLARVGLITPEGILRYWRHAVLVMVVLGAVFTPPDPLTQVMLAGIMTALFFLGYALARWTARPGRDAESA